jgi:hypothetical protein
MQEVEKLYNLSVVSCIPSYWETPGILTVSMAGLTSSSSIRSIQEHKNRAEVVRLPPLPFYFERTLQQISTFNPTTNIDSNDFRRQLYVLASMSHPGSQFLPEAISEAAQVLFSSVHAVFVSTAILQPAADPVASTAFMTTKQQKLVVVSPIAYVLIGILSYVALAIISMFWYGTQPNILLGAPTGLLSYAMILHGSNLHELVSEAVREWGRGTRLVQKIRERSVLERRYVTGRRTQWGRRSPWSLNGVRSLWLRSDRHLIIHNRAGFSGETIMRASVAMLEEKYRIESNLITPRPSRLEVVRMVKLVTIIK